MPKLRATDHAVLRYLERAGGFELDRLRAEIERRVAEAYRGRAYVHFPDERLTFVVRTDAGYPVISTVLEYKPQVHRKVGRK